MDVVVDFVQPRCALASRRLVTLEVLAFAADAAESPVQKAETRLVLELPLHSFADPVPPK